MVGRCAGRRSCCRGITVGIEVVVRLNVAADAGAGGESASASGKSLGLKLRTPSVSLPRAAGRRGFQYEHPYFVLH